MTPISETDRSVIKNMMLTKSYKDISFLVNRSISEVEIIVKELTDETGLISWQQKHNAKKKPKKSTKSISPEKKELREQKERNRQERRRVNHEKQRTVREYEQRFNTIKTDYSKKIMIKIDRHTYIYAEPGKEKETREEFLRSFGQAI